MCKLSNIFIIILLGLCATDSYATDNKESTSNTHDNMVINKSITSKELRKIYKVKQYNLEHKHESVKKLRAKHPEHLKSHYSKNKNHYKKQKRRRIRAMQVNNSSTQEMNDETFENIDYLLNDIYDEAKINSKNFDPYEKSNRKTHKMNHKIDQILLKSTASMYAKTPNVIQRAIENFFNNLHEIDNFINAILQGSRKKAAKAAARFMMNSTVGFLGLADVAAKTGIKHERITFTQTLQKWGVKSGPYIILPILGPSTIRDTIGLFVSMVTSPVFYLTNSMGIGLALNYTEIMSMRSKLLHISKEFDNSLDPYSKWRSIYQQRLKD